MERKWRRKAIGVAAEIKSITNRAFKAHNNKGADQEQDDDLTLSDGAPATETGVEGAEPAAAATKPKRSKKAAAAQPAEAVVA